MDKGQENMHMRAYANAWRGQRKVSGISRAIHEGGRGDAIAGEAGSAMGSATDGRIGRAERDLGQEGALEGELFRSWDRPEDVRGNGLGIIQPSVGEVRI